MHTALDREIVIDSPKGPNWVTRGAALIDLLSDLWTSTRVSFRAHPMGTTAQIKGPLTALKDAGPRSN